MYNHYQFIIGNLERNIIAIKLWLDSCPETRHNIEVHFLVRGLVGVLALALYNIMYKYDDMMKIIFR